MICSFFVFLRTMFLNNLANLYARVEDLHLCLMTWRVAHNKAPFLGTPWMCKTTTTTMCWLALYYCFLVNRLSFFPLLKKSRCHDVEPLKVSSVNSVFNYWVYIVRASTRQLAVGSRAGRENFWDDNFLVRDFLPACGLTTTGAEHIKKLWWEIGWIMVTDLGPLHTTAAQVKRPWDRTAIESPKKWAENSH